VHCFGLLFAGSLFSFAAFVCLILAAQKRSLQVAQSEKTKQKKTKKKRKMKKKRKKNTKISHFRD